MNPSERSILLPVRAILGSLFSFETLLLLYMFAGMYKGDPRFAWIPVDPTGLFFALSVVVGSFIIVRNPIPRRALPVIFAMLMFVLWWIVSLTWSPSDTYGPDKVFYLTTLVLWGLTAGALIVGPDPERLRRFFTLLLLLATWVGLESLLLYGADPDRLFYGEGPEERLFGSYQHIGRVTGLGALVAFTAWLFGRRLRAASLLSLALFTGLAFVVTISGGKGPVLELSAAILLPLALGLRITRRKIFYKSYQVSIIFVVGAMVAGLSAYIAVSDHTPRSLLRLASMIEGGEFRGTAAERATYYERVFDIWPDAPVLGHGAGSWPILEHGREHRDSPHNLFLEVLLETGVVGLILFLALLTVALGPISLERVRNDPLAMCAIMLFLHQFLSSMRGGDVSEHRFMFMALGMLTVFAVRNAAREADPAALPLAEQFGSGVASLSSRPGRYRV